MHETWAVLIGMGTFRDEKLPKIPMVKNLTRLQKVLVNPEIMGLPPTQLIIIENQENLYHQLITAFEKIPNLLDTLIIYYVGHGIRHPDQLYLASVESKNDDPKSALSLQDLWELT